MIKWKVGRVGYCSCGVIQDQRGLVTVVGEAVVVVVVVVVLDVDVVPVVGLVVFCNCDEHLAFTLASSSLLLAAAGPRQSSRNWFLMNVSAPPPCSAQRTPAARESRSAAASLITDTELLARS